MSLSTSPLDVSLVIPVVVIADPGLARADGRAHDPTLLARALLGRSSASE